MLLSMEREQKDSRHGKKFYFFFFFHRQLFFSVAGFATYMSHIGASQSLVRVAVKPVAGI